MRPAEQVKEWEQFVVCGWEDHPTDTTLIQPLYHARWAIMFVRDVHEDAKDMKS